MSRVILLSLVSGACPAYGQHCLIDSCTSSAESALSSSLHLLQVGMSVNSITSDKEQYSSVLGGTAHRPSKVSQQVALGTSDEDTKNLHQAQDRMTSMLATVDRICKHVAIATGRTVPEVVLIPVLFVAVWLAWTSLSANGLKPLNLTSSEWTYVLLFMGLSASSTLALRQTHGSKVQMTIEACVLLYALKAAASLGLLVFKQSMSFADIIEGLLKKGDANMGVPVWCYLALTGSLFAAYDALSFGASQHMAPMSFQLLLNSPRTLLLVPLQYGVFGKKVTSWQVCALLIMGIGICALTAGDMKSLNTATHAKEWRDYIVAVVLIFGKVGVSAVALIVNEKTLKEMPLTVDAQNCIMYSFGMVPLVVAVLVGSLTGTDHQGMASIFGQIFSSSWMLLAVACMTSLGIVCAYLLKAFSAMEKEIMSGGVVALLAIGQWLTPGEAKLTPLSLECAPIIVASCVAYHLNAPMITLKGPLSPRASAMAAKT